MNQDLTTQKWYKRKENIFLLAILLVAALLRFHRLDSQSLWLDELQAMKQTDPGYSSWDMMFRSLRKDQHPPLFYILEKCFLTFFASGSHPEIMGRLLPAIFGVLGIWAVYLLGKELLNRNLGFVAATLTCINYFHLFYSQETRDYSLAFLTSALSYVFFIRLIRELSLKNRLLYGLFAALAAYSHYYGIFIVVSQFFVALLVLLIEKDKKAFLLNFAVSGAVIVLLYLPWLPYLLIIGRMKSFWTPAVPGDFFIDYLKDYFGNNNRMLLPVVLILLLLVALKAILTRRKGWAGIRNNPAVLLFVMMIAAILFVFVIPYLRSRFDFSMLFPRYTIVILPLLLTSIAYGIMLIPGSWIRMAVLAYFVIVFWKKVFIGGGFYTEPGKTQFREATNFATAVKNCPFPVLCDGLAAQEEYYFRKSGYTGPLLGDPRKVSIDSILQKSSPRYDAGGFWIIGIHHKDHYFDSATQVAVDSQYVLAKEQSYFDAFAQLYVKKKRQE